MANPTTPAKPAPEAAAAPVNKGAETSHPAAAAKPAAQSAAATAHPAAAAKPVTKAVAAPVKATHAAVATPAVAAQTTLPVLYCPGMDSNMQTISANFMFNFAEGYVPQAYSTMLQGGGGGLGILADQATLYLLSHGHEVLPVFCLEIAPTSWTAPQMATLIQGDGLPTTHVGITLLVCYAGLSTVSAAGWAAIQQVRARYQAAVAAGGANPGFWASRTIAKAAAAYQAAISAADPPSTYTSARQLQPLSCQLVLQLQALGYTSVQVTAFKAEVSTTFAGGNIYLQPLTGGARVSTTSPTGQALTVTWH